VGHMWGWAMKWTEGLRCAWCLIWGVGLVVVLCRAIAMAKMVVNELGLLRCVCVCVCVCVCGLTVKPQPCPLAPAAPPPMRALALLS